MDDSKLLTINQAVDELIITGYPATACGLRNAICRGTGPVIVPNDNGKYENGRIPRYVKWCDVLSWAENRTWYEPRQINASYVPDDSLMYQATLDTIILALKQQHPKLFDRLNKVHGYSRIIALNEIATHALEHAENELLLYVESSDL